MPGAGPALRPAFPLAPARALRALAQARTLLVLAAMLLLPHPARGAQNGSNGANSGKKLPAARLETPPVIDGDVSDAVWQQAARGEQFSDSFTGNSEIDQTTVWLAYDDHAIYVAFHCLDQKPDAIVGREVRRDASFRGEDSVTFSIDPFRTRQGNGTSYFSTNPLGTPQSYIAGGRAGKAEWKGDWECAARRLPDGWSAEMRIPWRALNFPSRGGPLTMGINFFRQQERLKLYSHWSNLGPEFRRELDGDWIGVELPRGTFHREVSLLPYQTFILNAGRGRDILFGLGRERMVNLGLDVRAPLTPELTAVGTLNPDFATVESAVEGIDFTRGERFVPDTRPFFLEGGDLFEVNTTRNYGWGQAFFSRRVPAFDGGAKVYGRIGARDSLAFFGARNEQTHRDDVVARWTHDVGASSFVGGYLVSRGLPGDRNTVYGVNKSVRRGNWLFRTDIAGSAGEQAGGMAASTDVRWDRGPWRLNAGFTRVAPSFLAANGFVQFTDYQGGDATARYRMLWRDRPIRELDLVVQGLHQVRTSGDFFRQFLVGRAEVETRSDWSFRTRYEIGRFEEGHDSELTLGVTRNVSNRRNRIGVDYSFGRRGNDPIAYLAPSISRRLPGGIDVSLSSALLNFRGQQSLHVVNFSRELDRYRAFGGRVLVRDGRLHYFISYRVSGGKGMETYFLLGDPVMDARKSHTYFMTKVIYPVSF